MLVDLRGQMREVKGLFWSVLQLVGSQNPIEGVRLGPGEREGGGGGGDHSELSRSHRSYRKGEGKRESCGTAKL